MIKCFINYQSGSDLLLRQSLFLACQRFNTVTNLCECEGQSWFKRFLCFVFIHVDVFAYPRLKTTAAVHILRYYAEV
jgi:hypothetical protein